MPVSLLPYAERLAPYAPDLRYERGELWVEEVPLSELVKRFGSPLFVYSKATLLSRARGLREALSAVAPRMHVACKANENLTLLSLLREEGYGADCVSGGELRRAEAAGFEASDMVFNGNGKTDEELILAHRMEIALIVADSLFELPAIVETARVTGRKEVPIALRLNPDIDPRTHPYLSTALESSKFGLPLADLAPALDFIKAHPELRLIGLHCHLGSQITDAAPYTQAAEYLIGHAEALRAQGFPIADLTLGGGFAVAYADGEAFDLAGFAATLTTLFGATDYQLRLEPGRYLVADCGLLATTVLGMKRTATKTFLVVDAAMTDNIRPALYHARHPVVPGRPDGSPVTCDLVGPVCESGDFLALDVELPAMERGELVAQLSVGAYSYAMQSHYNARRRPAEVLVSGNNFTLIRDRESYEDLGRKDLYFPEE